MWRVISSILFKSEEKRNMELGPPDREFVELVKHHRRRKSSKPIFNASFSHALVLVKQLLECAVEEGEPIKIISGNFEGDFYKSLDGVFKDVANMKLNDNFKGVANMEIIVLNPHYEDTAGKKDYLNELEINTKDNSMVKIIKAKNIKFSDYRHFILVGTNKYRLETDHDSAKATASFNDFEVGTILLKYFENLKSKLTTKATPDIKTSDSVIQE